MKTVKVTVKLSKDFRATCMGYNSSSPSAYDHPGASFVIDVADSFDAHSVGEIVYAITNSYPEEMLIDHANNSKEWGMAQEWDDDLNLLPPAPGKPQLMFVKDSGIYLMSNGIPIHPTGSGSHVVYAAGYDPNKQDPGDVYDRARDAVGGDDFAEYIDIASLPPKPPGVKRFVIRVNTNSMTIAWRA